MGYTNRQQLILGRLLISEHSTSNLLALLAQGSFVISEDSLARDITALREDGFIESYGAGPARKHRITSRGRLSAPIGFDTLAAYLTTNRQPIHFNREWFKCLVGESLFGKSELDELNNLQVSFRSFMDRASKTIRDRWYQKWLIEFAWKSSMIEGNTYDELETETLLLERIEARGKTHAEAVMILNHQTAIQYVYEHAVSFGAIDLKLLEVVHSLVIEGLDVNKGIRDIGVGISGSVYRPLATKGELMQEVKQALQHINQSDNVWTRSLTILLALSYLQLFEDGNKRTARIMANGVLYGNGSLPLVLGTIDPTQYRRACIAFYELGSAYLMKQLLMDSWRATAESISNE